MPRKKVVGRGFGSCHQPQPTDRAPHKLERPGRSHQKGAGRTQRASKPRGPPPPEKIEVKRGQALLHEPEVAGGGLAWAEYYAAKAGISQESVAKQTGIQRNSFTRLRNRKIDSEQYEYPEPVDVGAPRLLTAEQELVLCQYVLNVDPRLSLAEYGEMTPAMENMGCSFEVSADTVQRSSSLRRLSLG